jgi:hypothetical protein
MAIDQGGPYLNGRARIQLIRVDTILGNWDDANASIAELRKELHPRSTIAELLTNVEKASIRLREKRERQIP